MAPALSPSSGCPVWGRATGHAEASPVHHLSPTHNEPFKPGSAGKIVPNTESLKDSSECSGSDAELPGRQGRRAVDPRPPDHEGVSQIGHRGRRRRLPRSYGWYQHRRRRLRGRRGYFFHSSTAPRSLIKYKGLQVAPAELEALLLTHPAILDAAVVRKPDEEAARVCRGLRVLKPPDARRPPPRASCLGRPAGAPHRALATSSSIDQIPQVASGRSPTGSDRPREVPPVNQIERVRGPGGPPGGPAPPSRSWYHFAAPEHGPTHEGTAAQVLS